MLKNLFHSTVFKIAALLCLVSFLALVTMLSSVFISDSAQNDAAAVNVAGTLRMQSYRLASYTQISNKTEQDQAEIQQLIQAFERDLNTGVLMSQQALIGTEQVSALYKQVSQAWFTNIRPMLINTAANPSTNHRLLNLSIQGFVDKLNQLVASYQNHAERNIAMIRLVQVLGLFGTLLLSALAMFLVNRHIKTPLAKLTFVARQLERGDFTARADESGHGELTILAKTFNKMSGSLYQSKSQLEAQVKRKTNDLQRSNECLDLLFQASRQINETQGESVNFDDIMQRLSDATGIKDLDLCIMTASGEGPYQHLMTTDKPMPEKCVTHDCHDCTEHDQLFPKAVNQLKYQLTHGDKHYGVLAVHPDASHALVDWQHQLFESVAEQIASCLSLKHHNEQDRRMALMNERTVIARELHDSLAQALSYLKIQVTRLQKLQQKENVQTQVDEVIDELKNGLSSAYRELRELLTTFRLKLDGQTLQEGFVQTIKQLQTRSDEIDFSLDYQVSHVPFTPQEEIHLLQIAREATQNAFYHSKGSKIAISITMDNRSTVTLKVQDNGIGIPSDPNKLNHYGLAIMQERSRNLAGQISVSPVQSGGTTVHFSFVPQYAKELNEQKESA